MVTATTPAPIIAVSLEPLDASTTLFLGHLAQRMPDTVRVVRYGDPTLADAIASARAVILVRGLFEFRGVVLAARLLRIPLYYFLDDNFIVLKDEPGPWSPYVEQYSRENVRRQLRSFQGVLLSSDALVDYFTAEKLHGHVALFPPIEWTQAPSRPAAAETLSVAFFGGRHLHDMFSSCVLPAVRRLALQRPVRLIAVGLAERVAPSQGLTVIDQPYEPSYSAGVRRLAAAGVDVLLHPSPGDLRNGPYKIPHALITAHAMGAIPVVSDRAPYADLRGLGVAALCEDSPESWYAALTQVDERNHRLAMTSQLSSYCASRFGGQVNRNVIDRLLGVHGAPAHGRPGRAVVVRAGMVLGRIAARLPGAA